MGKKRQPTITRSGNALCETCRGEGARRGELCALCGGSGEMSLRFDRAAREGRLWQKYCDYCGRFAKCLNVGTYADPEWICARCELVEREQMQPCVVCGETRLCVIGEGGPVCSDCLPEYVRMTA